MMQREVERDSQPGEKDREIENNRGKDRETSHNIANTLKR